MCKMVAAVAPNTFRNVGATMGAPIAVIEGSAALAAVAPGAGINIVTGGKAAVAAGLMHAETKRCTASP